MLPLCFEPASDQSVFRLNGAIATFGPFRLIAGEVDGQLPMREGGIVIGFQLLSGDQSGLNASGFQGFEKSLCHRFVDLHAAHVGAVGPRPLTMSLSAQW